MELDFISIIIPCKEIDDLTRECIASCENLYYPHREIIVVDDLICPGLPAEKRNWGMKQANGDIVAFIDSDATASPEWLNVALIYLMNHHAVCGPGIIPPGSPLLERVTDWIYRHLPYSYRVTPKPARIVSEFPTFNLLVWKDRAPKFKPYLTGEDSLFCREIKGQIYYNPSIVVYHKRRPAFRPLFKQIAIYGKHRGHFIRLALLGWIGTVWTYGVNFIKGFFRRKI